MRLARVVEVGRFCIYTEGKAAKYRNGLEVKCVRRKELKVDSRCLG